MPDTNPQDTPPKGISPEKYARLKAEAKAPYKGLRKVIYATAGASGAIGAFVILTQMLAGGDIQQALPNLLVQFGVLAVVAVLFRLENKNQP